MARGSIGDGATLTGQSGVPAGYLARFALIDEVERYDVRGGTERRSGGCRVAMAKLRGDVAARLGPDLRSAGLERGARIDHGRQRLVLHIDRVRRVARLGARLRDHRGDRFADEAHGACSQGMPGRRCAGRAVRTLEVRRRRQRLHAGPNKIFAGDHGGDAGHRGRGLGIDSGEPGMGVRRAQEDDVELLRRRVVVGEDALALEQLVVFDAQHRTAAAEARVVGFAHD